MGRTSPWRCVGGLAAPLEMLACCLAWVRLWPEYSVVRSHKTRRWDSIGYPASGTWFLIGELARRPAVIGRVGTRAMFHVEHG